ncbi:hypothetical protein BDW60DRAFT_80640 [Aspergillus nidulans var. acristatus]
MKSHLLALILAVCLSSVIAQSLPGLPDCAQGCANGAIPSKCSPVDVECICATRSFIDDMACCVGKSCNADDQKTALDFANGICGGAGVSDLPQSATCASDATTTTATASATVTNIEATTSDGKTTTTTAVTSTTESDQTSTEAASSTSADTSTQTSTSTETETPANSEDTDGATPLRGKSVGVLAGIVAGVAFVL